MRETQHEMPIPSASFSSTKDKDNVDEESDNEALLIKKRNSLSGIPNIRRRRSDRREKPYASPEVLEARYEEEV